MSKTGPNILENVPEQTPISWAIAFTVSWRGLKRRFLRLLITMAGVVLAIAFLAYMLITSELTNALVAANVEPLNLLLQQTGVDIFTAGKTDQMMLLLIGLSLLTCLVGIVNAMLMAVTERIKEIGTLKCLGALDSFIVKTFLIESSLQGIIGTLIGMILGLIVALLIAFVHYRGYTATYFPVLSVLKALVITFIVGSVISISASIAPAYMAAKKQPVDAMRIEE